MTTETESECRSVGSRLPRKIHALVVTIDHGHGPHLICRYDDQGEGSGKYRRFLREVADWFTKECQQFLQYPTWETLLDAPDDESPIVVPKHFMETAGPGSLLESEVLRGLRRCAAETWLLWPTMNMPLSQLFSPEAKARWVVLRLRRSLSPENLQLLATDHADTAAASPTQQGKVMALYQKLMADAGADEKAVAGIVYSLI